MERGKTESQGKSDAKEIVVGQDRGAAAQLRAERLQKADSLRQIGVNPYCNTFKPSETLTELRARYGDHDPDSLRALGETFAVAGRLVALRRMGKASFWRLQEGDTQLQVYLRRDDLGEESYERLRLFDRGDIVGVRGTLMKTKTGEFTLAAVSVVMLTKALQGLPDKWHGLTDVQQRYRQRYVDLIVNPDARRIALARCLVVQKLRRFLDDRGFVEVETPVLVGEAGGAEARPFRTHHNALDQDFVLRIATELHLKRLVVGGMHRVYEVGRLFRNEGVSTRHNPEFTSVEFYQAYATHEDLMHLTEHLLSHLVAQLRAQGLATSDQEQQTPFQIPFRRASIARLVAEHLQMGEVETDQLEHITSVAQALRLACGRTVTPQEPLLRCLKELEDAEIHDVLPDVKERGLTGGQLVDAACATLKNAADAAAFYDRLGQRIDEHFGGDQVRARRLALHVLYAVFEELVEHTIRQPTFVTGYSVSCSPLARPNDADPACVDRFELIWQGLEVANGFCELNDPVEQRARLQQQMRQRAQGDEEAHGLDEDFVRALEVGMPPTAGQGIGIDRLVMLLTGAPSIRDVILFPHMRPQGSLVK